MFFFFFPNYLAITDPVLEDFERGLAVVRRRYPQMTVGALETLIHIARSQPRILSEEFSLKDVASEMDVRYPTLTRHSDVLGSGIAGRGVLQLLEKVSTGRDQKERRVELTQNGADFVAELVSTIKSSTKISD